MRTRRIIGNEVGMSFPIHPPGGPTGYWRPELGQKNRHRHSCLREKSARWAHHGCSQKPGRGLALAQVSCGGWGLRCPGPQLRLVFCVLKASPVSLSLNFVEIFDLNLGKDLCSHGRVRTWGKRIQRPEVRGQPFGASWLAEVTSGFWLIQTFLGKLQSMSGEKILHKARISAITKKQNIFKALFSIRSFKTF